MKITSVSGCPYEDNEGEVLNLDVELSENEEISLGDMIDIEMMDGSFLKREVKIINPKLAGDYAPVSKKVRESNWSRSKQPVTIIKGACHCSVVVLNVPYHEVKTDAEIKSRALRAERESRYCLTPYSEIKLGKESIFDHLQEGYTIPEKVIEYLKTQKLYFMSPGIYPHPFKPEKDLLGPYVYTDGYYYWDRDTWKYSVKYGLVLPQEFIDHVISEEGTAFLNEYAGRTWKIKERKNMLNLLPDDHGDVSLDDF